MARYIVLWCLLAAFSTAANAQLMQVSPDMELAFRSKTSLFDSSDIERKRIFDELSQKQQVLQFQIEDIQRKYPRRSLNSAATRLLSEKRQAQDVLAAAKNFSVPFGVPTPLPESLSNLKANEKKINELRTVEAVSTLQYPSYLMCDGLVWRSDSLWSEEFRTQAATVKRYAFATGSISSFHPTNGRPITPPFGTGVPVSDRHILTNMHVATKFLLWRNGQWILDGGVDAVIQFTQEEESCEPTPVKSPIRYVVRSLTKILGSEGTVEDFAVLGVEPFKSETRNMPAHVDFRRSGVPVRNMRVGVFGYPARPFPPEYSGPLQVPDNLRTWLSDALIETFFATPRGGRPAPFGVLRLSVGVVFEVLGDAEFSHQAATIAGNSGGLIFSFSDGSPLGIHYASFGGSQPGGLNYALTAKRITAALVAEGIYR